MTHPEAAAALEEAELQQHMVRDHEDLAGLRPGDRVATGDADPA